MLFLRSASPFCSGRHDWTATQTVICAHLQCEHPSSHGFDAKREWNCTKRQVRTGTDDLNGSCRCHRCGRSDLLSKQQEACCTTSCPSDYDHNPQELRGSGLRCSETRNSGGFRVSHRRSAKRLPDMTVVCIHGTERSLPAFEPRRLQALGEDQSDRSLFDGRQFIHRVVQRGERYSAASRPSPSAPRSGCEQCRVQASH